MEKPVPRSALDDGIPYTNPDNAVTPNAITFELEW